MNKTQILILTASLLLTGCGNEHDESKRDLKQYLINVKSTYFNQKKTGEFTLPTVSTYEYQAHEFREPFSPFSGSTDKATHQPLRAFPLSALKLLGTMTKNKTIYAFIATPDNMIYEIKEGDIIGNHDGKVTAIFQDHINILEATSEYEGDTSAIERIVTLWLGKDQS